MKVIVLSDTHAPRRWRPVRRPWRSSCAARISSCTRVTCARRGVLGELAGYAPVRAVRGNNDGPDVAAWGAPDTLELDLDGLPVAMIHDAGPAPGRPGPDAPPVPPVRSWWSSATLISRSTAPRTGSGSSIPARRPTAAASRRAPSGSWISGMASSFTARIVPVTPPP